ncbi:T9SS type A sorting domain-containing protein [Aquimarina celericrescens]|uniref:T9SS type A sorting domain-containing protein n=1 Tax=Aquimarina celericrescens TaxID=1964542 RepID=A0ABW5ASM7_9FLAO|nr:T9SS type A sorting domain-containing protein [Aquimarina celericrescens]
MERYSKVLVSLIFILCSCALFAQETVINISNYQYNSTFKDRKCSERFRVTAHFTRGQAPRTFIDYRDGSTSAADQSYILQGTVSKLVVAVYAKDSRSRSGFGCLPFGEQEEVNETYEIPIDSNTCEINATGNSYSFEDEVSVDFSFDYQVTTKTGIDLRTAYNMSNENLGYEEFFTLSPKRGRFFRPRGNYQWQYRIGYTGQWINVPRPPSRRLRIRLIDFLDRSVIDQKVFFRIESCDDTDTDFTVVGRNVVEYGQLTKIDISNWYYDADFDDGRCKEDVILTAHFSDGTSKTFIKYKKGNFTIGSNRDTKYVLEGVVERIDVFMYGKDKVNLLLGKKCVSGDLGGRVKKTYPIEPNIDPCDSGFFNERQSDNNDFFGSYEVRQKLRFNWKITPLPKITRTLESDLIGYEDEFTLSASEGFNNSVYDWQYSFLEGTDALVWTDLPGASSPTRNIILADYPDHFDESVIGKEIVFRTLSCDDEGSQNVVSYIIRKSAPRIVNVATAPVSCYDGNDGSVTVTFDRPLIEGDVFGFVVSDPSAEEGEGVIRNMNNVYTFNERNEITIDSLKHSSPDFVINMIGDNSNDEPYFTGASYHQATFQVGNPTPVAFVGEPADSAVNVWCNGGQDGAITLDATGGVGGYEYLIKRSGEAYNEDDWVAFSSATSHRITNLLPDTYTIKLRDRNGCEAQIQTVIDGTIQLGAIIEKVVTITQPTTSLSLTTEILNEPTAFEFEDGRIIATINGGTAFNDNSYEFEWRDENNTIINTTSAVYNEGQGYLVTLHSIGEGEYTITARDANYDDATNKEGCTTISETITLAQPPKLEVNITIYPISCNAENEFSDNIDTNFDGVADQFQDGVLVATVSGGVPFDVENPDYSVAVPTNDKGDLTSYFYDWKIQLSDGSWEELSINDNHIDFLDTATNYSLNVRDKNGIVLGNYMSRIGADGSRVYELSEALDVVEYLPQPERLALTFRKTDVTCASGNDARVEVITTGGVAPYTYEWSNGDTSSTINNLIAGTYVVFVKDAKGCQIEANIRVEQSNDIEIEPLSVISPTCFEGDDGQISINVTGGVPPYSYLWNTGAISNQSQGLVAGTYSIAITDASGCIAFYEETLTDPDPVVVDLEEKRSLCGEQSLALDISIDDPNATYFWSSDTGFTSTNAAVTLTKTGRYTATITTGSGCVGAGEVIVEAFDRPIDSDFLITTQAYANEDVVLVNVSNPMGEAVDWTIPEGVQMISETREELILKFEEEGTYDINLRSYQGDCYQDFTKTILVQPAIETPQTTTSQKKFIEEFILYPNPSNGDFKTKISLGSASNINVKIINLISGATMHERAEEDNQEYVLDYTISMPTGIYLMLLETPNGSETRKLIVE